MTKFHSHYESLNVTRDAPPEVIRAAYRSLSQKHHPDKNSGNDEAARTMARLNAAYSVLSDADQRELYDLQILSQQRVREPNYAFQASVDDDSAPVPYAAFAEDKPEERQRPASKPPAGTAKGKTDALHTQLSHFLRGREARIAAIVLVLIAVVMLPILWSLWRDNQSMMRLEQAAMYAPGTADNPVEEIIDAKPSGRDVIQVSGPSGLDATSAELSKPAAAPQKAPAAAVKASDFERLTAMLKNMGLGLHKLDLPEAAPAKQAAAPAKAAEPAKAEPAKAASAPPPPVPAAKAAAAPEAARAREETERPATPEPVRGEARSVAETGRASAPPAASAAAAVASAGRVRAAVVVDARACPTPKYPHNSYYNGESGSVLLALLVGNDGKVIESKVQKSSGFPELDRAARRALTQCKFQAASGDAQGEPVWTNLTYVWSLD